MREEPERICEGGEKKGLSIILVSFNTKELTLRCLENLFREGLPQGTEVLVVDNGSEDGTFEAIGNEFPEVRVFHSEVNLGFARAVNLALSHSRGSYALLLNTDCFPQKGSIERLLLFMERNPGVGIAGGALLHPDGRPQNCFGRAPTLATELLPRGLLQITFPSRYPSKRRPPLGPVSVESVVGAFLMVRRDAWEQVGLMDEGFFLFLEETDWCLRMRKAGWHVYHVPEAKAVHIQGQSMRTNLKAARIEFYRSRYRFFLIHRGKGQLALLFVGLLIKGFVNWIWSAILSWVPGRNTDRWRERHRVDGRILAWHLMGCPRGWGLCPAEGES
jgi:GT2 family glycosyltransferase